ncbi:MAG TPA: lysylphosphatidylglycerol synthase transmembrane domain-containing protein [Gemmatimonadales bacterium]|nr:lysylphosphatidylglycerol synthase transmembrane domain-containing protein [Gemmatimonadales bacterium]
MKRWIWWLLGLAGLALVLRLAFHFPWDETGAALAGTNGLLLAGALLVNLISPVAKGWAWHLLLGALAPNRWWVAQEANLIGTAVNVVGVGVTGEAARVSVVMRRDQVPIRAAIVSVVGSRIVEALGLAVFLVVAPLAFDLPPAVRAAQLAGAILLLATFVMVRFRVWERLVTWLPQRLRPAAVELGVMGRGGRLLVPTLLAIVNWGAQWATYDLALRATHVAASPAASFTALLAVNLGGIIRITPANAGITQAAMAAALLPFGVPAERGVAAGLALQAIQVLPILAIGLAIVGRAGFSRLTAEARELRPSVD